MKTVKITEYWFWLECGHEIIFEPEDWCLEYEEVLCLSCGKLRGKWVHMIGAWRACCNECEFRAENKELPKLHASMLKHQRRYPKHGFTLHTGPAKMVLSAQ